VRKLTDLRGEVIDEGLVLWFPGPKSFTGEDVVEFQVHGGPAVLSALTVALSGLGARPAEPGEFTRRAFEAGRLELSQAEAVADLVDAETDAQRRQALGQLGGALAVRNAAWREALLDASAFLGAQMDFPDDDLPEGLAERAMQPLAQLALEIDVALADVRGERVREGFRVALIGAPNAGKSSLLNALIGREAAIVTAIPGTTRDVIEAALVIKGYKVVFADTAGIREATDEVEIEGVRRALVWAGDADLRLWLIDGSEDVDSPQVSQLTRPGDIVVFTKSDLGQISLEMRRNWADALGLDAVSASVIDPDGLGELVQSLEARVLERLSGAEFPAVTRLRHRRLLQQAEEHLKRGLGRSIADAELIAEDVRLAARSLEQLSGRLDPEAVLDRVFGSFCIGK
jgi:tRNA modification GTPase